MLKFKKRYFVAYVSQENAESVMKQYAICNSYMMRIAAYNVLFQSTTILYASQSPDAMCKAKRGKDSKETRYSRGFFLNGAMSQGRLKYDVWSGISVA